MSFRLHIDCSSFKSHVVRAAALVAAIIVAPTAQAVGLYWDANSGTLAGTGTWDTAATNWSTTSAGGGTHVAWSPNDGSVDANFGGNPGAGGSGLGGANGKVTVSGTINVDTLTFL